MCVGFPPTQIVKSERVCVCCKHLKACALCMTMVAKETRFPTPSVHAVPKNVNKMSQNPTFRGASRASFI